MTTICLIDPHSIADEIRGYLKVAHLSARNELVQRGKLQQQDRFPVPDPSSSPDQCVKELPRTTRKIYELWYWVDAMTKLYTSVASVSIGGPAHIYAGRIIALCEPAMHSCAHFCQILLEAALEYNLTLNVDALQRGVSAVEGAMRLKTELDSAISSMLTEMWGYIREHP
jgi:hypothetical protein